MEMGPGLVIHLDMNADIDILEFWSNCCDEKTKFIILRDNMHESNECMVFCKHVVNGNNLSM